MAGTVLFLAPLSEALAVSGQYADHASVVLRNVGYVIIVDVHQGRAN